MKGYVLVNISRMCNGCQLCIYNNFLDSWWCYGTCKNKNEQNKYEGKDCTEIDGNIVINNSKPDWCPIKVIPSFVDSYMYPEDKEWAEGYNDCLKDILGDENK